MFAALLGFFIIFAMFVVFAGFGATSLLLPVVGGIALFSQSRKAAAIRMLKPFAVVWALCLAGVIVVAMILPAPA